MKFFSLKPKNKKEDIKNYEIYKQALDFCFDKENDVNNIGIIGDYGTGKSTVIETYLKNEISVDEYDILKVSILTLKNDNSNSLILLKNIIKQIVQNPKKKLEYNILKFENSFLNWKDIGTTALFIFSFIFIFFMNSNFLSNIFFLNKLLNYNIPIEFFRAFKIFILSILIMGFIFFIYPKIFSGFKFSKISFSSKVEGEIEKSTDNLSDIEFDYLEYLIYLLKRKNKNLLLVIEDIDRYENIKVFEQLREVNNLLNNNEDGNKYKFIYAVGNSIFLNEDNKDIDNIRSVYESKFKENISKFFDFTVNIVPTMDSQNSYEFIKLNYPKILEDNLIDDEELFMISQYIDSPRILIDVMNDYQIMGKINIDKNKNHLKILYYSIMKSKFYNFYDIVHDIFEDLKNIIDRYNSIDVYEEIEKRRKEEFISKTLYYNAKRVARLSSSEGITLAEVLNLWEKIKKEPDISTIKEKYGTDIVHKGYYNSYSISVNELLNNFEENNKEVIFSSSQYTLTNDFERSHISKKSSEILKMYYDSKNEVIKGVTKRIEEERLLNPNKRNFYISDFLDIDFIKLGIIEEILNIDEYNLYISSNYLALEDSIFIKSFNLNESNIQLFELKLKDFKAIISKMKLEKIVKNNGLNIFLIEWIMNLEKEKMNEKTNRLVINSINSIEFVDIFLFKTFDDNRFSLYQYLNLFYKYIESPLSLKKTLEFLSSQKYREFHHISNEDVEEMIEQTAVKNKINVKETKYEEEWFYRIVLSNDIFIMNDEQNLLDLLTKCLDLDSDLFNLVLMKFNDKILNDMEKFSNWIDFFNKHIQYFSKHIEEDNIRLITSSYENTKNTVNVKLLSNIYNDFLLEFVYSKKYYEYNAENVIFIRDMLHEGFDSIPYIEYTEKNYKVFFELIKNHNEIRIHNELDWDKQILFRLFGSLDVADLEDILSVIKEYNSIKLEISELITQVINLENLSIIFTNIWLYENNFNNYQKIYTFISNLENTSYRIVLSDILNNSGFDLDLLFKDIDLIKQNSEIETIVYNCILGNNSIDLITFENYIKEHGSNFQLVSEDSISQEKLKLLFINNKLDISFFNVNFCDKELLIELFANDSLNFDTEISNFSIDNIMVILNKFEEEIVMYLIEILNYMNDDEKKIGLILRYVNTIKLKDKKIALVEFENILNNVTFENKNIIKIKELIKNKKGQRTVSKESKLICDFLEDIGVVVVEKIELSESVKLVYKN